MVKLIRSVVTFCVVVFLSGWVDRSRASAESNYEGLQLAPTLHGAVSAHDIRGGVGVDLSLGRWLDFELWGSRLSRPLADAHGHEVYPGAWATGVAINGRLGGATSMHAFVYGLGLTYTSSFECPQGCTIMSGVILEEDRIADHMVAFQTRLGYEARFKRGWFFRGLYTWDFPFSTGTVWADTGPRYPTHEPPLTFMFMSCMLNVGYAFRL